MKSLILSKRLADTFGTRKVDKATFDVVLGKLIEGKSSYIEIVIDGETIRISTLITEDLSYDLVSFASTLQNHCIGGEEEIERILNETTRKVRNICAVGLSSKL
jgi:hypothetical protein